MAEKTRCEICNRTFKNHEGLEQHNAAMHGIKAEKNEEIKSGSSKSYMSYIIAILILLGAAYFFYNSYSSQGKYDSFAQCLTDSGAKMYGAYWCPHCQEQKDLLGKSWKKVKYIECSLPNRGGQTEECNKAGIESYPTWEFADGKRIDSVLSLETLSATTGCKIS